MLAQSQFNHSPIESHLRFFPSFGYFKWIPLATFKKVLWTFMYRFLHEHKFFILWGKYPRVQMLGHMASTGLGFSFTCLTCLTGHNSATLFQRSCTILYGCQQRIGILRIFTSVWHYDYFWLYPVWQVCSDMPAAALICVSLMADDVEQLFTCFCATRISSSVRCLFLSLSMREPGCLFSYCWVLRVLNVF